MCAGIKLAKILDEKLSKYHAEGNIYHAYIGQNLY